MGSVSVSQQATTQSGSTFTVYATITWDSSFTVTVSPYLGDVGNIVYYWRVRGQKPDTTEYIGTTSGSTTASFQATNGKSYAFQVWSTSGNRSDGAIFTVTDGSSSGGGSGGGSGSTATHYITISQGKNTQLTVTRIRSNSGSTGVIQNGDQVWNLDRFTISCTASDGYELAPYVYGETEYDFAFSGFDVSESYFELYYGVSDNGSSNPSVVSTAYPKQYTLSISQGNHSSIYITRISSEDTDAVIGAELADGDAIYHFDKLQVNFEADTGYDCSLRTASGQVLSDGDIIQVSDDVSIISEATVKQYTLILEPSAGSTITVRRTSSPLQNATIGVVNNNETIYHSDVLEITLSSSPEYKIVNQYVNQEAFASGDTFEVTEDITVKTVTELSGIAYIYDGASFGQYLIHIFHNGEWAQYIPYVYKDSTWNICS